MAELVLGAILSALFKQLTSPEMLKFVNREKVRDLVKKWETKLRSISVLLEDAEDKAMRGSDGRVQPWLDDLKDLVYDIEDVVDEFVTQEAIRGLEKKAAVGTSTGKGLPLAAKTLGGLLRSKSSSTEWWQYILDSEIWNLPQGSDGILPALKLSYFHLPSYAKRCFTFCAIFPQDYEFDRDELVQLWMAEGLVDMDPHMPRRSMRDQGLQQFDVLLSRSFFQRSSQNESGFFMHDLMHVGVYEYMFL